MQWLEKGFGSKGSKGRLKILRVHDGAELDYSSTGWWEKCTCVTLKPHFIFLCWNFCEVKYLKWPSNHKEDMVVQYMFLSIFVFPKWPMSEIGFHNMSHYYYKYNSKTKLLITLDWASPRVNLLCSFRGSLLPGADFSFSVQEF